MSDVINYSRLESLGACDPALEWIGDRSYPLTAVGVAKARADGATRSWFDWLVSYDNSLPEGFIRAAVSVIDADCTITEGVHFVIGDSAPTITIRGGYLRTIGDSKPVITVHDGYLRTIGNSAPTITVNGGAVRTEGDSAPVITVSGDGEVCTCDRSAPVITRVPSGRKPRPLTSPR